MRLRNVSLRRGIVVQLAILILSAMLLIHFVTLKVWERDLLRSRMDGGRAALEVLGRVVSTAPGRTPRPSLEAVPRAPVLETLETAGFSSALMVDAAGDAIQRVGTFRGNETEAAANAGGALAGRDWHVSLAGKAWGATWFAPERLHMAMPVFEQGRPVGAINISAELGPLYQGLRRSQGKILLVIVLNTLVLVLAGLYLLSRTVIGPVHRLLDITDRFQPERPFPSLPEAPRNEIGRLFGSLNAMIRRMEENKGRLKETIASLELANRALRSAGDEMIRSEKLASVGRLAAGVAHEIGNPLSIVLGYLELLKGEGLDDERRKDFLDRTEYEIQRIAGTIRRLLNFATPGSGEPRSIHAHEVVRDTVAMMKPHLLLSRIRVDVRFEAADDRVRTDPNLFQQVVLNLAMNGADAMKGYLSEAADSREGVLTITTRNRERGLQIRFQDQGPGIPREALAHIFDPFFTTKEPGMGSGLGLSVCHRIVDDLGGRIRLEGLPGEGTTVIVEIPLEPPGHPGDMTDE